MTRLQQIVNKAKELRKAHPKKYAKWTDYVKAASKSIKPAAKKVGIVKKKATPKKTTQHKDTRSHNVNIRVISGMDPGQTLRELENWKKIIFELQKELKTAPIGFKAIIRQDIAAAKKFERKKKALLKKQLK